MRAFLPAKAGVIVFASLALVGVLASPSSAATNWATRGQMSAATLTLAEATAANPSGLAPTASTDAFRSHTSTASSGVLLNAPGAQEFSRSYSWTDPKAATPAGILLDQFATPKAAKSYWSALSGKITGAKTTVTRENGLFTMVLELPSADPSVPTTYRVSQARAAGRLLVFGLCIGQDSVAATACANGVLTAELAKSKSLA